MTATRWFYVQDGKRHGPVDRERLLEMLFGSLVPKDIRVWRQGLEGWTSAEGVPEIACELPPPVPPPPLPVAPRDPVPELEATFAESEPSTATPAPEDSLETTGVPEGPGGEAPEGTRSLRSRGPRRWRWPKDSRELKRLVRWVTAVVASAVVVWYTLANRSCHEEHRGGELRGTTSLTATR